MTLTRRLTLAFALLAGIAPAFAQVPAPVPALPDTERRTSYSISGTTCACNVNFALYGDSTDYQNWVEVWLNGVRVNYNDGTFGWTITSPSGPLSNLARPISDAVLTFTAVQTGTVQIVGARRPRRTTTFQENVGVPTRNFNQILNDLTAQNRELWDKTNDFTGRGLFGVPGETISTMPGAATRAGKFLYFDATGLIPQFTSGASGTGNVVGPPASVVNNLACWNNTSGTLLSSCGVANVTPELFGDGIPCSTSSSAGIAKAEAALEAAGHGGALWFANCDYHTSELTVQGTGIRWVGQQQAPFNATRVIYTPSVAGGAALTVTANPATGILSNFTIENITFTTSDTTTYKVGLRVHDGSVITANNVSFRNFNGGNGGVAQTISGAASSGSANEIRLTVSGASTNFNNGQAVAVTGYVCDSTPSDDCNNDANKSWPIIVVDGTHIDLKGSTFVAYVSGGTVQQSSTAIQTLGRELLQFSKSTFTGDLAFQMSANPNFAGGGEAMDESHFDDITLVSTGTNCILQIDDGTVPSSLFFTPAQSWGGGKSAVCWYDKSSTPITSQIEFNGLRAEQPSVAGGWDYDIHPKNSTYSLILNNPILERTNGFRVRNIPNFTVNSANWLSTGRCGDVDSSVRSMHLGGASYWFPGSTAILTGLFLINSAGFNPATGCLPVNGTYSNSSTTVAQFGNMNSFGAATIAGNIQSGVNGTIAGSLTMEGSTSGQGTATAQAVMGSAAWVWPTNSGTIAVSASTPIVVNAATGNITCPTCVTGGSGSLSTLTFGAHLTSGGSSYNGAAAVTITSDATNANTASTIVARDGSGNFSAGTITAALTGHASSDLALAGGTMAGSIAMGGFNIGGAGSIAASAFITSGTSSTNGAQIANGPSSGTGAGSYFLSQVAGSNNIGMGGYSALISGGAFDSTPSIFGASAIGVFIGGTTKAMNIGIGTVGIPGITNVATTSAVCVNPATGLLTYDGTIGSCTTSDETLKNMGPRIDHALEKLLQINGVNYTWKDPAYGTGPQIGVGAQTVEKVFPELVQTGSDGIKSVDYQRLTAPIIEAMRELKADNDNLRACQESWKCRIFGR